MRIAIPLALSALAIGAAPSVAATVTVSEQFPGDPPGAAKQVVIADSAGQTNSIAITYTYDESTATSPFDLGSSVVTVRDFATPPTPGDGCTSTDSSTVRCEVDELAVIRIMLGAGADEGSVSPLSDVSCDCVTLEGGDGADDLTSFDGAYVDGGEGDDRITGRTGPATRIRGDAFIGPDAERIEGGPGNDVLDGGAGSDVIQGGPGDDRVLGGDAGDHLSGGYLSPFGRVAPAGRDHVDAGEGNDDLTDGDVIPPGEGQLAPDEVGPDTLIGGSGEDRLDAYRHRTEPVWVDPTTPDRDGQMGENDHVVNVETIQGGTARDFLYGDGDRNFLLVGAGGSEVYGRGGADLIVATSAARHMVSGDRGEDVIETAPWVRGPFSCGSGIDWVRQARVPAFRRRQPDPARNLGPVLRGDCEAISQGTRQLGSWALQPEPRLRGRELHFSQVPATSYRSKFEAIVTRGKQPFEELGRARVEREGATIRLPRAFARRLARRDTLLRAVVREERFDHTGFMLTRMIWRFPAGGRAAGAD